MSVAVTSSIVPGTCAYPAPRAFGRRRVHRRKKRRRREEKEAVEAKSDGSALRTVKRDAEEESKISARACRCVPHHVTLSGYLHTQLKYYRVIIESSLSNCCRVALDRRNTALREFHVASITRMDQQKNTVLL